MDAANSWCSRQDIGKWNRCAAWRCHPFLRKTGPGRIYRPWNKELHCLVWFWKTGHYLDQEEKASCWGIVKSTAPFRNHCSSGQWFASLPDIWSQMTTGVPCATSQNSLSTFFWQSEFHLESALHHKKMQDAQNLNFPAVLFRADEGDAARTKKTTNIFHTRWTLEAVSWSTLLPF